MIPATKMPSSALSGFGPCACEKKTFLICMILGVFYATGVEGSIATPGSSSNQLEWTDHTASCPLNTCGTPLPLPSRLGCGSSFFFPPWRGRYRELWALHSESMAFGGKGTGAGQQGGSMASGMAQVKHANLRVNLSVLPYGGASFVLLIFLSAKTNFSSRGRRYFGAII